MSTVINPSPTAPASVRPTDNQEVVVISHSMLFYWWPVWAVGYVMALLTYFQGVATRFEDIEVLIHPNRSLGVTFTIVFLLVLVMTHMAVRGPASLTVIVAILAMTFLFAWMHWWEPVLRAMGNLVIYMNLGFYLFFSTAIFVLWAGSVFFVDRLNYYKIRPGQLVHVTVFGGGEETFDTHGMSVLKLRDDVFRHWVLGLGSGDLHIATTGAKKAEFVVPNVLFVGAKLERIQELVSMKPDENLNNAVTVGGPV